MVITRQDKSIIIEASDSINMGAVQKVIDYINILEIAAQNQGTDEDASELAMQVNKNWWAENKSRFLP
ncbi:hypothetical protein [Dyadobacter psychrophilus]|uniref:Uncharacterized protein n=1 Tax=Dyadobacter psychrophilus TaxID=651661 RepID=A0A1T5EF20_9BACT|nr:hypothetical protein [Dyadobacter psychrophilus]SKB82524.1 hypothetical protein SAMN05660293_02396 [Dyadobacter psychrophilus]